MNFRVTVSDAALGDAFFDNMPAEAREFLEPGFSQLAVFSAQSLKSIASYAARWLDPRETAPDIDSLAREFEVNALAMNAVMAAVTIQASALFAARRPTPSDKFIERATEVGIIRDEHASAVQTFGTKYLTPRSAEFRDALARANASTHIVPSFQSLTTTIDLRVAAIDAQGVVTMPMILAMLRTDVGDQELVFQMTPRDVGQLLQQLKKLEVRLGRLKGTKTQSRA